MSSGLQSTCRKKQTANREMDPIRTAKQSERWPVLREIWKVETCFFLQKLGFQESSTATTQGGQLFGMVQLDYAVWREALQKPFAQSLPNSIATGWNDHESQGNWTWTPFTKLVSRRFLCSSSPSWQAWALMKLHQDLLQVTLWWVYTVFTGFWNRILESKANLLSKSSVTRQGDSMAW